jgi:hypothetical protein
VTFVQAGTRPERLVLAAAATADANGLIAFRLGPAPLGFVWQGSVTVTNAPSGALFTASVASTPWGQWAGPTNFGPVQLWGNETLTVAGVGLQKNTQYALTFFGVSLPEAQADPLPPVAPTSVVAVETATLLVNGVAFGGPVSIRPPTLTRRLTIVAQSTSAVTPTGVYAVKGDTSGAIYGTFTVLNPSTRAAVPQFIEIEPAIDATYTISNIAGANGSFTLWVLASSTNPLVAANPNTPLPTIDSYGPFTQIFDVAIAANTINQGLLVASATGFSYFLQTLTVACKAANGIMYLAFHAVGSSNAIARMILPSTGSETITFPGGFEIASLQVDTFFATTVGSLIVSGTYALAVTE